MRYSAGCTAVSQPEELEEEVKEGSKKQDRERKGTVGFILHLVSCLLLLEMVKQKRAKGECLGAKSRRRTQKAAKCHGETQTVSDPWMSEWGNPAEETSVTVW